MQTYVRWLLCVTLYLGSAQFAFLAFIQKPGNPDSFEKARLPDLVNGSGHRPFVYRTLLPTSVRLIRSTLSFSVERALADLTQNYPPLKKLLAATPAAEEREPATYVIAYVLEFASLIGFALVLRLAVLHFYPSSIWLADVLPAGALLCLPVFYRYVSYDYDFPHLFVFTCGLVLLARRRWRWFYPVLILSAFSKETAILLAFIHVAGHWKRMPQRALAVHAAVQVAVVVLVRALLQFVVFADNPGTPVEVWYARNWELISDVRRWRFLFFHFAWVGNTSLVVPTNYNVVFVLLIPLVCCRWSKKPIILRRGLWIFPVLLVSTFCFGYFDEIRAYYETYPIVVLLAAGSLSSPLEKCSAVPRGRPKTASGVTHEG